MVSEYEADDLVAAVSCASVAVVFVIPGNRLIIGIVIPDPNRGRNDFHHFVEGHRAGVLA